MKRAVVSYRELASLPPTTLGVLAMAAARDIDHGEDKRELLERIMSAIACGYSTAALAPAGKSL